MYAQFEQLYWRTSMYKFVIAAFIFLSITSCTSEDQQAIDDVAELIEFFSDDETENSVANVNATTGNELQAVTGFGETATISSANKTDLTVSGSNNTVNIQTNLGELKVGGSNNFLNFSPNVSVDACNVTGADNSAQKDASVTLVCEVNGSGNSGFE